MLSLSLDIFAAMAAISEVLYLATDSSGRITYASFRNLLRKLRLNTKEVTNAKEEEAVNYVLLTVVGRVKCRTYSRESAP